MKTQLPRWFVLAVLVAAPVSAGFGDALPGNSCSTEKFKSKYAVLDVSAGGCPGGTFAQTAITCTVKKADPSGDADFVVEFFDEVSGLAITPPGGVPSCAMALGSTVTFTTAPGGSMPTAWSTGVVPVTSTGSCGVDCFLHGSARVLSTGKIQCTATRIDLSEDCLAFFPSIPLTTQNLTVIKIPRQKGD